MNQVGRADLLDHAGHIDIERLQPRGHSVRLGIPFRPQARRSVQIDCCDIASFGQRDGIAANPTAQVPNRPLETLCLVPRDGLRRGLFESFAVEPHRGGSRELAPRLKTQLMQRQRGTYEVVRVELAKTRLQPQTRVRLGRDHFQDRR